MKRILAALLAALCLALPARAFETPKITVTPSALASGKHVEGRLTVSIPAGWHLYAPGAEPYIPVKASPGEGPIRDVSFSYPPGMPIDLLGEQVPVYEGSVPILFMLEATGPGTWRPSIRYQACSERICLAPVTVAVEVALP